MKNVYCWPPWWWHVTDLPVQGKRCSTRASPPHRTATVTQQLFFFSDRSLLVSWLIIHHLRGKRRAFMYTTPVAVFTSRVSGLPRHFHVCPPSLGGESQAASHERRLAIVCGVPCLQFPQCSFVFFHQMSPLVLDFGVYPACH